MGTVDSKAQIGFWSLVSIVIGAQLGASIFLLPSELAKFRTLGILGWAIGGLGAVLIATVFAYLCMKTSKTGGPHIYARMFFGEKVGFFLTWIYWCGSWACNPILIATAINYLMSFIGDGLSSEASLVFEIFMVLSLTLINIRGVKTAGYVDIFLSCIKLVPLFIIPIIAFNKIDLAHFEQITPVNMGPWKTVVSATILSFWGFVGLEGGASPSGVVKNPKKTIPLAIIIGTAFVAIISIINTISIFGIIDPGELENIGAPFARAMTVLFGSSYEKILGLLAFIMCYGSLNAWIFFSGQIARTAASENILPKFFQKLNKNGAPSNAIWTGTLGTIAILFLRKYTSFGDTLTEFINMSVIIYVILYITGILAYAKFMKISKRSSIIQIAVTSLAFAFCFLVLIKSNPRDFMALLILAVSGIPVYFKNKRQD